MIAVQRYTGARIVLLVISLEATSRPHRHERLGGHLRLGGCRDLRPVEGMCH